jgi:hypothetical protein
MGWELYVEGEIRLAAPIEAPEHEGRYITLRRNAEGKVIALAPSQENVWVKTTHDLPVEELVEITALLPAGITGEGNIRFEYESEGAEYQHSVQATLANGLIQIAILRAAEKWGPGLEWGTPGQEVEERTYLKR